jgi:glycosyltransferase involved in cell wall biosynthesis
MLVHDAKIAFVIPALNEEVNLRNTLTTIQRLFGHCDHVIISDNGSKDSTVAVAHQFGARTTVHPGVSIAQLRNEGFKLTDAEILVFIDSDIQLDDSWPAYFAETVASLRQNPLQLCGSRCRAIHKDNYVCRYWYNRLSHQQSSNYINSGHLIVHRQLFEAIGGFDASLRTAEDYDFCQRAIKAGAALSPNPQLIAWHDGYPETIQGFMAREMWHGRDEFKSVMSVLKSKVALVAIGTTLFFVASIIGSVICGCAWPLFGYLAVWSILLLLLTVQKFGASPIASLPHSAALYYLYLISRSLAWRFKARRPQARS